MTVANTTAIGRELCVRAGEPAENHRNQAVPPCAGWLTSKTMNQIEAQLRNREHRHAVPTQPITNGRLVAIVITACILSRDWRSPECLCFVVVAPCTSGRMKRPPHSFLPCRRRPSSLICLPPWRLGPLPKRGEKARSVRCRLPPQGDSRHQQSRSRRHWRW
jgi:hypothetical protein